MPEEKPRLKSYTMMSHYDPGLDGDATVIVGFTGTGSYVIRAVKAPAGRLRREQKAEMLARLQDAIAAGLPPGEVSMDGPRPERLDAAFDPEDF